MRAPAFGLALGALLAGCVDLNESISTFKDYGEFLDHRDRVHGWVPDDLVPKSATNIEMARNSDSSTVRLQFDHAPADGAALAHGFTTVGSVVVNDLRREQLLPGNESTEARLWIRCPAKPAAVEFLDTTGAAHASYWTSWDLRVRELACRNVPPPAA